ncbi:hypothetical protein B0H17DRAFT_1222876 [Mycena rosella]|uniref:Uncharacterized protein n=1 Tax=Mycena rosella TaxID=1033263 RepID=A0AAD7F876_MYCRO|nr:hypothetical protein B0H17DRAFT_1222876 [Mycena rosella]
MPLRIPPIDGSPGTLPMLIHHPNIVHDIPCDHQCPSLRKRSHIPPLQCCPALPCDYPAPHLLQMPYHLCDYAHALHTMPARTANLRSTVDRMRSLDKPWLPFPIAHNYVFTFSRTMGNPPCHLCLLRITNTLCTTIDLCHSGGDGFR